MHGQGIDREVAAEQVHFDGGEFHRGQGGRVFVVFEPGRGHIHALAIGQGDVIAMAYFDRENTRPGVPVERTAQVFDLLLGDNLAGRKAHIAECGSQFLDLADIS